MIFWQRLPRRWEFQRSGSKCTRSMRSHQTPTNNTLRVFTSLRDPLTLHSSSWRHGLPWCQGGWSRWVFCFSLLIPVGQILFLYLHCAGLPGPHQGPRSVGISARVFSYLFSSSNQINKGTGYSESTGKVMKDLWGRGTSKSSNELKSWPQPPCQLRLMKIYFLRHNISHLWLKMAIIWPFFSNFWPIFADFLLYRLHLCVL